MDTVRKRLLDALVNKQTVKILSKERLNAYYRHLKRTFVAMLLLCNEGHFRTIRTQVSQPASGGNVTDMSELQAQNWMTPHQWTGLLCSVSVISENKTVIARIKSIKLLNSGFLETFGS